MKIDEAMEYSSSWSREQDKAFENALATYSEDSNDRWEKITTQVPGKNLEEIKHHFELLLEDIENIEAGRIPLPCYVSTSEGSADHTGKKGTDKKGGHLGHLHSDSNHGGKGSRSDQERRKGIAWTEDEHRLFLLGLDKYGKGDWRSISRNFVVTRTPTQVASHAQKYFIRLNSMNKERRRSSIHDITSVGNGDIAPPQGPITGQANGPGPTGGGGAGSSGKSSTKQQAPPPASSSGPGVGVYGATTIGQPVGVPHIPAVGTPVNLSGSPHMAYGMRAPMPGASMTYPMPHAASHR
ncbi:hypothetical protein GIB67_003543 [Kingdonia uniflora]|uniref:Uncharacterized protein n=1 Tax=Kingdonia uniflora TaxID=39325 RepID=A0A7J7MEM1_9MAGN|nr:hypothetical protein GIB67_003543 [Kingdonia uniflora]